MRGGAQAGGSVLLGEVDELAEQGARGAAGDEGDADVVAAVGLFVHADVVACGDRFGRCRAVGELVAEVFGFEDLAELLRAPVGEQELQSGFVAQAAVAVVAEDLGDAEPGVDDLVGGDPGAEAFGEAGDDGQGAADPEVVADAVFGVVDGDEGAVVDLVDDVLAGVAGDRGLVFARQVRQ